MRLAYDSTSAWDIPTDAKVVGGYVDGLYKWDAAAWARFPDAAKIKIACFASTDEGNCLDVESGCSEPKDAPAWVKRRRAAGEDPTVYVNLSNIGAVKQAFDLAGERYPFFWLAHYDGKGEITDIPPDCIAKQYANPAITGEHYDLSVCPDFWPGIDKKEVPILSGDPEYIGESSAVVTLKKGEVGWLQAIWRYPNGSIHTKTRKVYGERPQMLPYIIYPDAEPGSDATEDLDSQPGTFIVAII